MRQSFLGDLGNLLDESKYAHGGDRRKLAEQAGCAPEDLLDFSVSLNPLGPPEWLGREMSRAAAEVDRYPDTQSPEVTLAACELYKVWPTQVMAGSGATELLHAATSLAVSKGAKQALTPAPTYVDYSRVSDLCGLPKKTVPLSSKDDFRLDMNRLESALDKPSAVFLCHPNNPTGAALDTDAVGSLAKKHGDSLFIVDESFADFDPGLARMVRQRPDNVVVLHSLTKFFAIPGLRLGLAFAEPETVLRMQKRLPTWSVNVVAQRVGARALKDTDYHRRTVDETARLRNELHRELMEVPGLRVFPAHANYLLCRTDRVGATARPLFDFLLTRRMPVRMCDNFDGLDERYFRIGLRDEQDNARLIDALREFSGLSPKRATGKAVQAGQPTRRTPAIMVQGTCSDAGKSVLAAALCRILLQDGYRVAPFKAQNMSNNSFVTAGGGEMGRAQVTQAEACRLSPDVRMNPVLLKPGSDTGSQVVLMGKAVGNMGVQQYHQYKPKAFEAVKNAYDSLAAEFDVVVLEGAGSPAEVNLKAHDIVNMAMAEHADCPVLLTGDIDRGGVYAALAGTMSLLPEDERRRVCGYALNKFRGDESLLRPAHDALFELTGKNVLGVIPWLPDLGLPEEDSVAFKAGRTNTCGVEKLPEEQCLDVVVLDLPRIANFNDLDPLAAERDVRLRVVDAAADMGSPDLVIIPGSKATVTDMKTLKGAGLAAVLRAMAADFDGTAEIVGICGGFQMLGETIEDPFGLESRSREVRGFGLLPLKTVMERDKTLSRSCCTHAPTGEQVTGYEIHHGATEALSPKVLPVITDPEGRPLGWGRERIWGTYLHGLFDEDGFRRAYLNGLRRRKGLDALEAGTASRNLDDALDRLADVVRSRLDMRTIYTAMGLDPGEQARLV